MGDGKYRAEVCCEMQLRFIPSVLGIGSIEKHKFRIDNEQIGLSEIRNESEKQDSLPTLLKDIYKMTDFFSF